MKNILITIIGLSSVLNLSAQIFSENFNDQNGKGKIGAAEINITDDLNWSIDISDTTIVSGDNFGVIEDRFSTNDLDGIGIWTSATIDITAYEEIGFSLDVFNEGDLENTDYIDVSYSLDQGMSWYQVENWDNEGSNSHTLIGDTGSDSGWMKGSPVSISESNLMGSTFQLQLSIYSNGTNDIIEFDNISVYAEQLTVPEPASIGILSALSIFIFTLRKRKK